MPELGYVLQVWHGQQHDLLGRGADRQQVMWPRGHGDGQGVAVHGGAAGLRPRGRIPDRDEGVRVPGSHVLPARRVGHRRHGAAHLHLHQPRLLRHIPQDNRPVLAARNQAGAVGAEGETDNLVVVLEADRFQRRRGPQLHGRQVHAEHERGLRLPARRPRDEAFRVLVADLLHLDGEAPLHVHDHNAGPRRGVHRTALRAWH
mmetsp:Transcript_76052/g.201980  ORF Transcript_76052/g.201980 Transcript_76052/m.201980 type:complete len:203 (-) Transcript_76052:222-830(-)